MEYTNKIELSEEALYSLIKDAYQNGYSTYEMVEAGLESYDTDTYARYVIKTKLEFTQLNIKDKYVIVDVSNMSYIKNVDGNIIYYDTEEEAIEACNMLDFEWACPCKSSQMYLYNQ